MKNINFTLPEALHPITWPVPKVLAFTTTRHHPSRLKTSHFAYSSFNLGDHVGDDNHQVQQHRQQLTQFLPVNTQIQWLTQVHGAEVIKVLQHSNNPYVADAAVTKQPGIALAVMTADCLPILITSKNGDEIAAVHGGWRPLAKNILRATLEQMTTKAEDLFVWLGPCIGKQVFEVGDEVKACFTEQHQMFQPAFFPSMTGKFLADLQLIATLQLQSLGVNNISHLPHCTYTKEKDYYSYRRDGTTGRMASVIARIE